MGLTIPASFPPNQPFPFHSLQNPSCPPRSGLHLELTRCHWGAVLSSSEHPDVSASWEWGRRDYFMSPLRKQPPIDSHSLTQSSCCCCLLPCHPWTLWTNFGFPKTEVNSQGQLLYTSSSSFSRKKSLHCLLFEWWSKSERFLIVKFFELPEEGRKRRATLISQGPLQKGGTKGHFLSICPLRRRAVRLCQCHGPFVAVGSRRSSCPSPALAGMHTRCWARLSLAHGGQGRLVLFFLSLLCVEGTHKSLPGPLLESDNSKRAVPRGFFFWGFSRLLGHSRISWAKL